VTGHRANAREPFDVHVDQVARLLVLVAHHRRARLAWQAAHTRTAKDLVHRRPRHPQLAGDHRRPITGRTTQPQHHLGQPLGRQPWHPLRAARAIGQRLTIPITGEPLVRCLTARAARTCGPRHGRPALNQLHQLVPHPDRRTRITMSHERPFPTRLICRKTNPRRRGLSSASAPTPVGRAPTQSTECQ